MAAEGDKFDKELAGLKIDRTKRGREGPAAWAKWWILVGILLFSSLGVWRYGFAGAGVREVDTYRVAVETLGDSQDRVILNAAGYIVAHHKIEVASKVVGRVRWIGVEKGDYVERDEVLVRLEDDEFQARVRQSEGNLASLQARLAELEAGSRPEEVALAKANWEEAKADLENAHINLERTRTLADEGVLAAQALDDAKALYDRRAARVESLDQSYELVRIGPRQEQIESVRGQVKQAEGELAYTRTMLRATQIRAPVSGTILERNVEVGEFVTTGFVGDRGAKGYVVSLADLDDLQVELDIGQDDFARLTPNQRGVVTTDAYRDRDYEGRIVEISPEADRQKATVQVKVQILKPDAYLRPEMNANVAFIAEHQETEQDGMAASITIPAAALRDGKTVFILQDRQAVERSVAVRGTTSAGVEISDGLIGGEDLILNPDPDLKDGDRVKPRPT